MKTLRQMASHLQVHPQTLYKWVWSNRIPHLRLPGGSIRFDPLRIEQWAAGKTFKGKK